MDDNGRGGGGGPAASSSSPPPHATPPPPPTNSSAGYVVTGRAAHGRVARLLRKLLRERGEAAGNDDGNDADAGRVGEGEGAGEGAEERGDGGDGFERRRRWVDLSPYAGGGGATSTPPSPSSSASSEPSPGSAPAPPPSVAFLWENAPRRETKPYRDAVKVYSHLPNGILLDDKWALARLLGGTGGSEGGDRGGSGSGSGSCGGADGGSGEGSEGGVGEEDARLDVLESRCFRGAGFASFARAVGLLDDPPARPASPAGPGECRFEDLLAAPLSAPPPPSPSNLWVIKDAMSNGAGGIWIVDGSNVRDFLDDDNDDDVDDDGDEKNSSNPSVLHPEHRYVAQRYAWPPTLYGGRKCHVRAYALITCDGKAYVHRKGFLHVANDAFSYGGCKGGGGGGDVGGGDVDDGGGGFAPSVHITNCCANSHDPSKFAGEICVDLGKPGPFSVRGGVGGDGDCRGGVGGGDAAKGDGGVLRLGDYLPSIAASTSALARRFGPYLRGGEGNGGFEYLGLDFALSSAAEESPGEGPGVESRRGRRPAAYLLEANAPPSQDTATGLDRAERVHDAVVSDLLEMWALPRLGVESGGREGGWICVHDPKEDADDKTGPGRGIDVMAPSKAAVLNRMRWAVRERKAARREERQSSARNREGGRDDRRQWRRPSEPVTRGAEGPLADDNGRHLSGVEALAEAKFDLDALASLVRSRFPCFDPEKGVEDGRTIFFENGGGAQVPRSVSDAVAAAMERRDRSVAGEGHMRRAREALLSLLACDEDGHGRRRDDADKPLGILGANATSLLDLLARQIEDAETIGPGDEVVIASENHVANVDPWIRLARRTGARVRWWTVSDISRGDDEDTPDRATSSFVLSDLLTERTRVVALSHVSNVLGAERDVRAAADLVCRVAGGQGAHLVVDGVAAAPHLLPSDSITGETPGVDCWYVASLHKMFGPHLGCLVGRRGAIRRLRGRRGEDATAAPKTFPEGRNATSPAMSDEEISKSWEVGTTNYEACAGAVALRDYFDAVAASARKTLSVACKEEGDAKSVRLRGLTSREAASEFTNEQHDSLYMDPAIFRPSDNVSIVRACIWRVEARLLYRLLGHLRRYAPLVRIVDDPGKMRVDHDSDPGIRRRRVPIVCFVHRDISSRDIVTHCRRHGLACRASRFLSTTMLWDELGLGTREGDKGEVVRFSLAHYNTVEEVDQSVRILNWIGGWGEPK
ncbi:hypothetical protein ACHAWF_018411 [Thalassiosira exigua]